MALCKYTIHVSESVLEDLRNRLKHTRWPKPIHGSGWKYGANINYIREICQYWQEEYDWRKYEKILNTFPQYLRNVDGIDIHFLHIKGKGPDPFPLVLIHGWPSSIYEFYDLIGPLADPVSYGGNPGDAFDLIIPSIPGFGFSGQPRESGWGSGKIALAFNTLMSRELGYSRYGAHGGDWGAMISAKMGSAHPENLAGIHINFVFLPLPFGDLPKEDLRVVEKLEKFSALESAYAQLHATKPDSLSIAQSDSPAGIAAWIIEKFRTWSDCSGKLEKSFSKDKLLTNIMVYWVTNSIASSARLYYESHADETFNFGFPKVEVPTGVALFPGDPFNRPRSWAEKHYNITQWTQMPYGGHFPAMEAPELLISDIRAFFRTVR